MAIVFLFIFHHSSAFLNIYSREEVPKARHYKDLEKLCVHNKITLVLKMKQMDPTSSSPNHHF